MASLRSVARVVLISGAAAGLSLSLTSQNVTTTTTIRVASDLVYLDVTVVDRKGKPVVTGLTKSDFAITEDGKPQRIFSFDAPAAGVETSPAASPATTPDTVKTSNTRTASEGLATILVLDLL